MKTQRGTIVVGALLCICFLAVWSEWALLGSRLQRVEQQARKLEEQNAQHEQHQRRGVLEGLVKETAKTMGERLDSHSQEQDSTFKSFEERVAAIEERMDTFLKTLGELKAASAKASVRASSADAEAKQQQQLDALTKSVESAAKDWLDKFEHLQASVEQQNLKLLGFEVTAKMAKEQVQELQKLRVEVKEEHETLSSILARHQTQVASVAEKQQALETRISIAGSSPARTQGGSKAAVGAAVLSAVAAAGGAGALHDRLAVAQQADAGQDDSKAAQLNSAVTDLDEQQEQLEGSDAVQGSSSLTGEELKDNDERADLASTTAKTAVSDIPTATSSVAEAPSNALAMAGGGTAGGDLPSASSSVVTTTEAKSSPAAALPVASTGGVARVKGVPAATSSVVAAGSDQVAPKATVSIANLAGQALASPQDASSVAAGLPSATTNKAGAATLSAANSPARSAALSEGLGLGQQAAEKGSPGVMLAASAGLDDTDREAQDQLAALSGTEEGVADADKAANIVATSLHEDKLLAGGADNGPTAASSVVEAPSGTASVLAGGAKAQAGARTAADRTAKTAVLTDRLRGARSKPLTSTQRKLLTV